nr:TIGR04141 family sporadically distributed protein [Kibdelosporangium phytohabitans]
MRCAHALASDGHNSQKQANRPAPRQHSASSERRRSRASNCDGAILDQLPIVDINAQVPGRLRSNFKCHGAASITQHICRPTTKHETSRAQTATCKHKLKFELADVVGPQDEQVHIKWLASATALSHLITQARVSAWSQRLKPEARRQLDDKVRALDSGRRITERPKTFVLAAAGRKWHVDELFTLSMIGLLKLRNDLLCLGVDLQFADIPFTPKRKKSANKRAA